MTKCRGVYAVLMPACLKNKRQTHSSIQNSHNLPPMHSLIFDLRIGLVPERIVTIGWLDMPGDTVGFFGILFGIVVRRSVILSAAIAIISRSHDSGTQSSTKVLVQSKVLLCERHSHCDRGDIVDDNNNNNNKRCKRVKQAIRRTHV